MTVVPGRARGLVIAALLLAPASSVAQEARSPARETPVPQWLVVEPLPGDDRPMPEREQIRGLVELERELDGHLLSGARFDHAVRAITERDHARRRRDTARVFDERIRVEAGHEAEARERAIRLLEEFVRQHPGDAVHTPDALLRLAELHYARAVARAEASDLAEEPDLGSTIAILERVVAGFPAFARIDAALYLLGYCLDRAGRADEAMRAFRALVCSEGEDETTCSPRVPGSPLLAESWLRLGEHHFDDAEPGSLDRAIAAYRRVLDVEPEGTLAGLARYKLAWALYRADRYPEAIEQFGELVEASDRARERTGRAGSELREEALAYVAITLAWDDWNGDREPDPVRALDRARDPRILPQDRGWTVDVYLRLGAIQFEEDRYDDAIATWSEALARWPLDHRAPITTVRIARALERLGRSDDATARRAMLAAYGEGSEWAAHNRELHPREVRDAGELAERALIEDAIRAHQLAQRARRDAGGDEGALPDAAAALYARAARLYREHLVLHPNSADRYEIEYDLAEALFWSGHYEEAAIHYEAVRDSTFDDRYLAQAARRAAESYLRTIERERIEIRDEPPPAGEIVEVPEAVQRLAHAREVLLVRVDAAHDGERVRPAFALENAILLAAYGYSDLARERFRAIVASDCTSESGREAWTRLRNLAVSRDDEDEIERLAREVAARSCAAPPEPSVANECGTPACDQDVACLAGCDLRALAFRAAERRFRAAEAAPEAERAQRYEEAAAALVAAADAARTHDQAPLALRLAAEALERAGRPDAASRVYERILDEVAPMRSPDEAHQRDLDRTVAAAFYRRGESARRAYDPDRALSSFRVLIDDPRFVRSDDPEIALRREDALARSADIAAERGDHRRAAELYRRLAESTRDAANARAARFRAAEMALAQRDLDGAARAFDAFATAHASDPEAAELVVRARARLAEVRGHQGRSSERDRALRDTVETFRARGLGPRSPVARDAAEARLALADAERRAMRRVDLDPGAQPTLEAWVRTLTQRIDEASRAALAVDRAYAEVIAFGQPAQSVAALAAQGAAFEELARAILDVPFTLPRELAVLRRSPARLAELEDRIRQVLEERVRPVECLAITRYAQAARVARAASLDDASSRAAIDRLQAYGDERIAECIEAQRTQDPTLAPHEPGELFRARHAPVPIPEEGLGPPSLAP